MHDLKFRCLTCRGSVYAVSGRCAACGRCHLDAHGILSFIPVRDGLASEKAFYDQHYSGREGRPQSRQQTVTEAAAGWRDPWRPHDALVWEKMRDITGKRVLLIGNGGSEKELAFLTLNPAALVYSDLSSVAVKRMLQRYELSGYDGTLWGVAIDAFSLPVEDASIDVVYGYAMVHHLPNVPAFLAEVHRVLTPGGRCVFLDDAYSPLWHNAKRTVLRPLMRYSHRKWGISPEDFRFSASGGFREEELSGVIAKLGGKPWFHRTGFLTYIWHRGATKLIPSTVRNFFLPARLGRVLAGADRLLWPRAALVRLIWGFDKPGLAGSHTGE